MKLAKLFQPARPLFWLMVVLQLLSSAFVLVLNVFAPGVLLTVVLSGFALANGLVGIAIALRLMRD